MDARAREALLRHEAEINALMLGQGKHPGIVRLEDAKLRSDPPWLRYEFIDGGTLAGLVQQRQRQGQPLTVVEATSIIRELAETVGHFHRLQPRAVVHRDLKPANVLIQRAGAHRYLIADFGIGDVAARGSLDQSLRGTSQGALPTMLVGAHTPLYASKQQKNGDPADVRDDVFALGVIWYQLLVSDLGSERPSGRWKKRLEAAGMSAGLLDLLEGCCDDAPGERADDAADLAEKISRLQQGKVTPPPPPTGTDIDQLIGAHRYDEAVRLLEAKPSGQRDYPRLLQVRKLWQAHAFQAADYQASQQHDYAEAVATLEALPEPLRQEDDGRLERYRASAAEVTRLEEEIDSECDSHRTTWTRLKVDRLLQLNPTHRHRGLVQTLGEIKTTGEYSRSQRVKELRSQLAGLKAAQPWQKFGEWHSARVGRLLNLPYAGYVLLVLVWFFYGFLWIPAWYMIEQVVVQARGQKGKQAEIQRIEGELRSFDAQP
jgi:serine/threonine protein kinase